MDCSPSGSSVHGIIQEKILDWVAISFSRDLPDPGTEPRSPAMQENSLLSEPAGKVIKKVNKFNRIEIISTLFSDYNGMKIEINYTKQMGKIRNMWRINYITKISKGQ